MWYQLKVHQKTLKIETLLFKGHQNYKIIIWKLNPVKFLVPNFILPHIKGNEETLNPVIVLKSFEFYIKLFGKPPKRELLAALQQSRLGQGKSKHNLKTLKSDMCKQMSLSVVLLL